MPLCGPCAMYHVLCGPCAMCCAGHPGFKWPSRAFWLLPCRQLFYVHLEELTCKRLEERTCKGHQDLDLITCKDLDLITCMGHQERELIKCLFTLAVFVGVPSSRSTQVHILWANTHAASASNSYPQERETPILKRTHSILKRTHSIVVRELSSSVRARAVPWHCVALVKKKNPPPPVQWMCIKLAARVAVGASRVLKE